MNTAPTEHSGEDWIESGDSSLVPLSPRGTGTARHLVLLFYGLGVVLWSVVVLGTMSDTLV